MAVTKQLTDDRKRRDTALMKVGRLAVAGCVAGVLFNLAFGAAPWHVEGLMGGTAAGILIYLLS